MLYGIVDETIFYEHPKKVAFLLKETNGNELAGGLRKAIRNGTIVGGFSTSKQMLNPEMNVIAAHFIKHSIMSVCGWMFFMIL